MGNLTKEEFKQELKKHDLDVGSFLDLQDAWSRLDWACRTELLKEEMNNNNKS